jgi:hypothetical protein
MRLIMKAKLLAASLLALLASGSAFASDVGVSISVGQPGFYGRIDIGDYPAPQLIYRQPVIIYLRVPPGHAKNWAKHCRHYNACGQRVYFVQDGWYNREYVPRYQERHGGPDRRDYRDGHRDDRHDDRHDDRGHGKGHGHGHDRRD